MKNRKDIRKAKYIYATLTHIMKRKWRYCIEVATKRQIIETIQIHHAKSANSVQKQERRKREVHRVEFVIEEQKVYTANSCEINSMRLWLFKTLWTQQRDMKWYEVSQPIQCTTIIQFFLIFSQTFQECFKHVYNTNLTQHDNLP